VNESRSRRRRGEEVVGSVIVGLRWDGPDCELADQSSPTHIFISSKYKHIYNKAYFTQHIIQ
jgi:hypothetical protein